jgi:hypothetical protein
MKRWSMVALAAAGAIAFLSNQASAQVLGNPGFEDPIVFMGSAEGNWFGFNGGGGAAAANSNIMPHSGAQHLLLDIPGSNNNFAGAFQDVVGVVPGQLATFGVWHKSVGTFDAGAELRIEWRNPANTAEVSRTPNFVPTLTSDYTQFSMQGVVPPGAGIARVVYAIQTFGPEPTNVGTAYVDDATFSVVPEPTTLALVSLGGIALAILRRRRD